MRRCGWRGGIGAALGVILGVACAVAPPAVAEVLDRIVAVVNDEPITQREVEELMLPLFASPEQAETLSTRQVQEASAAALRQLIEERLVVQAAKQAKIEVSEADVEERFRQVRAHFATPAEFEQALAEQGLTRQDLLRRFREQLLSRRLIDREVRSKITVSPTEVERYFAAHTADFAVLEEVRARHILIRITAEHPEAEAAKLAQDLCQQLQADHGAAFAALAQQHSQGPEAEKGGDLGWVKRGQLMADLDGPLFALPVHGLSAPIRTKLGYHLFFVEDRHQGSQQTLEQARAQVEDRVYAEKFKQAFEAWMAKLQDKAYIQIKQIK